MANWNDWAKKHPNLVKLKEILGDIKYSHWTSLQGDSVWNWMEDDKLEEKAKQVIDGINQKIIEDTK